MATDLSQIPLFDRRFLDDHAGSIISDPNVAIIELVANSWDAGATLVQISVPPDLGGKLSITDNGVGMTESEFLHRWRTLGYNRLDHQGPDVNFPKGTTAGKRKAFGRNGKGRHAMFCFADSYFVETWKNGEACTFEVRRGTTVPFQIERVSQNERSGSGTRLWTSQERHLLNARDVLELIGSRFIADPHFAVEVNGRSVTLEDLTNYYSSEFINVDGVGQVEVLCFDAQRKHRTSQHHGVAWWVDDRLVGEPTWEGIQGPYLDRRSSEAKRFTFVVRADVLRDHVVTARASWPHNFALIRPESCPERPSDSNTRRGNV